MRHDVGHTWLIERIAQTLEAFERHDRAWLLLGTFRDDDEISLAPFAAIHLSLSEFWV